MYLAELEAMFVAYYLPTDSEHEYMPMFSWFSRSYKHSHPWSNRFLLKAVTFSFFRSSQKCDTARFFGSSQPTGGLSVCLVHYELGTITWKWRSE